MKHIVIRGLGHRKFAKLTQAQKPKQNSGMGKEDVRTLYQSQIFFTENPVCSRYYSFAHIVFLMFLSNADALLFNYIFRTLMVTKL